MSIPNRSTQPIHINHTHMNCTDTNHTSTNHTSTNHTGANHTYKSYTTNMNNRPESLLEWKDICQSAYTSGKSNPCQRPRRACRDRPPPSFYNKVIVFRDKHNNNKRAVAYIDNQGYISRNIPMPDPLDDDVDDVDDFNNENDDEYSQTALPPTDIPFGDNNSTNDIIQGLLSETEHESSSDSEGDSIRSSKRRRLGNSPYVLEEDSSDGDTSESESCLSTEEDEYEEDIDNEEPE